MCICALDDRAAGDSEQWGLTAYPHWTLYDRVYKIRVSSIYTLHMLNDGYCSTPRTGTWLH